ncbi:MAG: class I SAM-dependent methyltransferase [Candidatus Polarisedimenticolia bacterium]|nr:class I SAM-dependent methyltransferase [bacterium]
MTRGAFPNPWLGIPAADYEGHMGDPRVAQLQLLGDVFEESLREFRPAAVVVPGCATGNGFERIDPKATRRIVGIDINPEFLKLARERHAARLPGLELIRGDLAEVELEAGAFDFVFAGLIFEYVEPAPLLARCARWLRRGGVLGTALQLPCPAGKVSASVYPSLERLAPVIDLVDPARLDEAAAAAGFAPPRRRVAQLPNGKRFALGVHVRA